MLTAATIIATFAGKGGDNKLATSTFQAEVKALANRTRKASQAVG